MKIDAFISYSRDESDSANALFSLLRGWGLRPWLDISYLTPECPWQQEIASAIEGCSSFLCLFSDSTPFDRGYFLEELRQSLVRMASNASGDFMIPIRITPCDLVRFGLGHLPSVDFFPDLEVGIAQLCAALQRVGLNPVRCAEEPELDMLRDRSLLNPRYPICSQYKGAVSDLASWINWYKMMRDTISREPTTDRGDQDFDEACESVERREEDLASLVEKIEQLGEVPKGRALRDVKLLEFL